MRKQNVFSSAAEASVVLLVVLYVIMQSTRHRGCARGAASRSLADPATSKKEGEQGRRPVRFRIPPEQVGWCPNVGLDQSRIRQHSYTVEMGGSSWFAFARCFRGLPRPGWGWPPRAPGGGGRRHPFRRSSRLQQTLVSHQWAQSALQRIVITRGSHRACRCASLGGVFLRSIRIAIGGHRGKHAPDILPQLKRRPLGRGGAVVVRAVHHCNYDRAPGALDGVISSSWIRQ